MVNFAAAVESGRWRPLSSTDDSRPAALGCNELLQLHPLLSSFLFHLFFRPQLDKAVSVLFSLFFSSELFCVDFAFLTTF